MKCAHEEAKPAFTQAAYLPQSSQRPETPRTQYLHNAVQVIFAIEMRRYLVNSESNIACSTQNSDMDRMAVPLGAPSYVVPPEPDHAARWALKETALLSIFDKVGRRKRFQSYHD